MTTKLVAAVSFLAFAGCVTARPVCPETPPGARFVGGHEPTPEVLYVCALLDQDDGKGMLFTCIEYDKFAKRLSTEHAER